MLNAIDLFCGCGGLSLGFEEAGINIALGIDSWQDAINTFNHNHKKSKGLCKDLSTLNPADLEPELKGKSIDLIIGGPPCQAYSSLGRAKDDNGMKNDPRNYLFESYHFAVE